MLSVAVCMTGRYRSYGRYSPMTSMASHNCTPLSSCEMIIYLCKWQTCLMPCLKLAHQGLKQANAHFPLLTTHKQQTIYVHPLITVCLILGAGKWGRWPSC